VNLDTALPSVSDAASVMRPARNSATLSLPEGQAGVVQVQLLDDLKQVDRPCGSDRTQKFIAATI